VYERTHAPGFRWLHESFGTNWRMLEMQAVLGRIQLARMNEWAAARKRNAEAIWAACSEFAALRVPAMGCSGCGAREGMDCFVPRNDSSNVIASAARQSMDCFVPRDDGFNVIASEARQSMDCFVPRNDGVGCAHAHYKCYAYVQLERLAPGWSRDRIVEAINAEGVPCYQGSCSEVYLEKAFDDTGWRPQERLTTAKILGETSIMFLVHPTLNDAEIAKTCEVVRRVMGMAAHA
jgi:dTDP-4-amino-4,6-dideoxygalactose transaminase